MPSLPKGIRYLAVEGVLGAGKTTLVRYMCQALGAQILLEDFENNPFLTAFYENRKSFAFQTQIVFLLSRHKQIKDTFHQQNMFAPQIIADYAFPKDRIFASLNLDENEMALYNKIANLLEKDIVKPDYVVYLQANTDVLLERIAMRDRAFERNIDLDYIAALNECYNSFFMHYDDTPLLIVNTNDIDFVRHPEDFQMILDTICRAPQGSNFYSPKPRR